MGRPRKQRVEEPKVKTPEQEQVVLKFKEGEITDTLGRDKKNELIVTARDKQLQVIEAAKTKLPKLFKKRAKELASEIEKYNIRVVQDGELIDSNEQLLDLCEYAFKPIINTNGTMMAYNHNELAVGFDYYRQIVKKLNKNGNFYVPTKEDFCRLMGISTDTLLSYRNSNVEEMREICAMINDYLASIYTQMGLTGKIEKLTAMFYQKSALGRKETSIEQLPQQVTNNIVIGDSELKDMLSKYL